MKLENEKELVERAAFGDKGTLETILCGLQDMIFNLPLRMLGMIPDPARLGFQEMQPCNHEDMVSRVDAMEELDSLSAVFADFSAHCSPERIAGWIRNLMASKSFGTVLPGQEAPV